MANLHGIGNKPRAKGSIEEWLIDQELFLTDPEDEGLAVHTHSSGAAGVWLLWLPFVRPANAGLRLPHREA